MTENISNYNLGDYASIVGLLITIVGFIYTLINVIKTRRASINAEKIALQVRADISKLDTVSLISTVISVMDEIKRLHRQGAWEILPERYSSIKKSLISIKSTYPELPLEHKKIIQSAISNFSSIEKQVETAIYQKTIPCDVDKLNILISRQVDKLQEIFIDVKNKIGK